MFNGKALYQPQGRSGEYSQWAINFFNGCTGGCEYCYNRRWPLLSAPKPTLKACFEGDRDKAIQIACTEIQEHKDEIIRDGGVFLSFVSDPCLPETVSLTDTVMEYCSAPCQYDLMKANNPDNLPKTIKELENIAIPVIILTKQTDWILKPDSPEYKDIREFILDDHFGFNKHVAIGFTLTGHDELEPGCSSNADRIKAMKFLHIRGHHTWASIEPIIDFRSSLEMIRACAPFCDHFKVGIRTDRKFTCTEDEIVSFVNGIRKTVWDTGSTVFFKQSFRNLVGGGYIIGSNFVEEGYNMFSGKGPDFEKIFNSNSL